jgi:hypothetical protein
MTPLPVVCWKWGKLFGPEYIHNLRSMLARHLHIPHKLFCITDEPAQLDADITALPMFTEHSEMKAGNRACFRRLRMFDRDMAQLIGPRFLHLDIDIVITGDITPLVLRPDPILVYDQNAGSTTKKVVYNPSFLLMDAGVLHHMWTEFHTNPDGVWKKAKSAGWSCSDMSVMGLYMDKLRPPTLGPKDGLFAYWRDVKPKGKLPDGARAVLFLGNQNPGDKAVLEKNPWIKEHWK